MKTFTAPALLPLLLLVLLQQQQLQVSSEQLAFSLQLQPDAKLLWDYSERENSIVMQLLVPADSQFFVIGFSPNGDLALADLAVVNLGAGGRPRISEYIVDSKGKSWRRVKSLNRIIAADFVGGRWRSVVLQRAINVGSDQERYSIDHGTTHIIFFKSSSNGDQLISSSSSGSGSSGRRITKRMVQLLRSKMPVPQLTAADAQVMEVRVSDVHIPQADTTYWCKVVQLPMMSDRYHIVGYEPVITKGSESLVHHLEVFLCVNGVSDSVRGYNAACNSETKPMGMASCRKVIGAWAMGADGIMFPEQAGLPIGGEQQQHQYAVIEIHYNNEQRRSDLIDSSGLRFFVTRRLRRHDVGILELGLDYLPNNAVPPAMHRFDLNGYCLSQCTAATLPPQGIWIFASQLHTHSTGVQVGTWHSRPGRFSRRVLNLDPHYSPHFQEIRLLPRSVHVMPGDSLTTSCTYNTEKRRNVTVGGLAISNEMCLNYVFYYPKVQLEVCKTVASRSALGEFFRRMREWYGAATSPKKSIEQNYASINWGKAEVDELRRFYETGLVRQSCNSSAGVEFPGRNWDNMSPPLLEPNLWNQD